MYPIDIFNNIILSKKQAVEYAKIAFKFSDFISIPAEFIDTIKKEIPDAKIRAIIGYPVGNHYINIKKIEIKEAISHEIYSLDFLPNPSFIKDNDKEAIKKELNMLNEFSNDIPINIIILKSLYKKDEIGLFTELIKQFPFKVSVIKENTKKNNAKKFIFSNSILKINLTTEKLTTEPIQKYRNLFGRHLANKFFQGDIALYHALNPENRIVFANGALTGFPIFGANRLSITSKSLLTNGIKTTSYYGNFGILLANIGIHALVIEGKFNKWKVIYITPDKIEFLDASQYIGLGITQTCNMLFKQFSRNIAILAIGPAGENLYPISTISGTDLLGNPMESLYRGNGFGAILGSKNIKAIVIDTETEYKIPEHPKDFEKLNNILKTAIKENTILSRSIGKYGSAVYIEALNTLNALPTKNFKESNYKRIEYINHNQLSKRIVEASNDPLNEIYSLLPLNYLKIDDNKYFPLPNFETLTGFGSNLEIDSIVEISKINKWVFEFGIDVFEFSSTLAMVLDSIYNDLGNINTINNIINRLNEKQGYEYILLSGTYACGKALGITRIPAYGGEALPFIELRNIPEITNLLLNSIMGNDLSQANILPYILEFGNELDSTHINSAILFSFILDFLGLHHEFINLFIKKAETLENVYNITTAAKNIRISEGILRNNLIQTIKEEAYFNKISGKIPDNLPDFLLYEKIPPKMQNLLPYIENLKNIYKKY